jgi:hypothetical protein
MLATLHCFTQQALVHCKSSLGKRIFDILRHGQLGFGREIIEPVSGKRKGVQSRGSKKKEEERNEKETQHNKTTEQNRTECERWVSLRC